MAITDDFTHFDARGNARMVQVGDKAETKRTAVASGRVLMNRNTFDLIRTGGVRKGDVLLEYDTSRTALGLEKEKLNLQQIQLKMEVARKNLETLKTLKPVSDADGGDYGGGFGEEGEVENEENPSKTYANLTGDAAALNETEEDAGTQGNPLRYLCLEQTTIQPSFLEMLQKKGLNHKFCGIKGYGRMPDGMHQ